MGYREMESSRCFTFSRLELRRSGESIPVNILDVRMNHFFFIWHTIKWHLKYSTDSGYWLHLFCKKKKKKTNAANRAPAKNDCRKTDRILCRKTVERLFQYFLSLEISRMMLTRYKSKRDRDGKKR